MPVDYPVSWEEFHVACKELSNKLKTSGKGPWTKVAAVTRGGLVASCIISRDLGVRVVDTVCLASYNHKDQSEVRLLKSTLDMGHGEGWLIIDDLSDTGNTFKAVREFLPEATLACPYVKPQGKALTDFYVREVSQDTWIYLPWEEQDFPPHIREKIGKHLDSV